MSKEYIIRAMVWRLLFLALLTPLPACAALLPTYGGRPPAPRGPEMGPVSAWQDYRGVIHCHSYLSHDSSGTEEEIVAAAQSVGLDFLIMTDHYTDAGVQEAIRGMRGQTLFLGGAEFKRLGGSFLALGITEPLDLSRSPQQLTEDIHAQGGLLFLGHIERIPVGRQFEVEADGWEVFNLHYAAKAADRMSTLLIGLFAPPQFLFRHLTHGNSHVRRWEKAQADRFLSAIAGNDAHANVNLFGPLGGTVGTYEEVFRTVTTHVWARELSRSAILEALKQGRSYISYDTLRDATGFQVSKFEKEGKPHWRIFFPEPARLSLRCNGESVPSRGGARQTWEIPIDNPSGRYTLRASLRGKPWIIAGPFVPENY